MASSEKQRIEDLQRTRRKWREENDVKQEPQFFKQAQSPKTFLHSHFPSLLNINQSFTVFQIQMKNRKYRTVGYQIQGHLRNVAFVSQDSPFLMTALSSPPTGSWWTPTTGSDGSPTTRTGSCVKTPASSTWSTPSACGSTHRDPRHIVIIAHRKGP